MSLTTPRRPALTSTDSSAALYQYLVEKDLEVALRVCELLAAHVDVDDAEQVGEVITQARQAAQDGMWPATRHSRERCRILSRQLMQTAAGPVARHVADLLSLGDALVYHALYAATLRYGAVTVATEITAAGLGIRDDRCAGLLAAYAKAEFGSNRLRWVVDQLWCRPMRAWLIPVTLDLADVAYQAAPTRVTDRCDEYAAVLARLADEPLSAAQAEVAVVLAYDGTLEPSSIPPTARLLA